MDDKNKNPEDEAPDDEIESPVDGPTPDWMRLATSGGGSGSSLTDENTPAWLKSIRSGQGRTSEQPIEPPELPSPPQSEAAGTSDDDEMSDLERLLAEEGIDLSSVAEERPEDAGDMSARDWLISTSSEEIIRNKLGAHPVEEEPAKPPPADAPGPAEAAASDDDMPDLERLLAEEGIDLGSVAEERPEDAGDMSARDWLIATSGEEIIRNKLGTQPVEEEPAAPPGATASDDKMVVEDDLPDWLQEMAEDSSGEAEPAFDVGATPSPKPTAADEDDRLVVAEELPDWLQEFAEETQDAAGAAMESGEGPAESDEDRLVAAEELPDWLREAADEPSGADEAGVTLPDFDQAPDTPADRSTSASPDEDKMVVEADLPDWLREDSDMPSSAAAQPVEPDFSEALPPDETPFPSDEEDKMVVAADLPDWLQEIADEPETTFAEADDLPAPSAAGQFAPPSDDEDKMVVAADLPDWLQEIADEPPVSGQEEPAETSEVAPAASFDDDDIDDDKIMAEDELPDWLRETGAESEAEELPPLPSAAGADKMVVAEDLPDWLREVEADSAEPESVTAGTDLDATPTDFDELDSDEDLPDWLREVEVSSLDDDLFTPAAETPREEPAEETPLPAFTSAETDLELPEDDEDLPGWLKEVQERDGKETAELIGEPLSAAFEAVDSEDEMVVDEGLPDWLTEVQDEPTTPAYEEIETTAETEQADQMIVEEDLPDWLREDQVDPDEPFEPSEPSPEPLAEAVVEEELIIGDELPDWLQEARDETPEGESLEAEMPTSVAMAEPAGGSSDGMIDEGELPDWLREAAEDEEEAEAWTSEEPAPEPVVASSEAADSFTAAEAEEMEEVEVEPEETEIELEIELADEAIEVEEEAPVSPVESEPVSVTEPMETGPASGGIPDWLQKLREVEEEEPPMVPVTPLPAPGLAAAAKPVPQPVYAQSMAAASPDIPADAEDRLNLARTARDKGDLNEAVRLYDSLVANGAYLDRIIEDLQQTIKANPGNYLLFQVMGDAMMRDGRLQSALKAYREALSKLS